MKKNIAIICTHLSKGGAERAAGYLSNQLDTDYNVKLFLFDNNNITYGYSGELVDTRISEIDSKFKKLGKKVYKLSFIFRFILTIYRVKSLKKLHNIDVSISFLDTPNIVNLLSKNTERVILSVRNTRSKQNTRLYEKFENYFIKKYYNRSDKIIALSHGVGLDLVENFEIKQEKISVIGNFIDYNYIVEKSKVSLDSNIESLFDQYNVIVNIGRLVDAKNQTMLIDAFARVKVTNTNSKLLIIGSGINKDKLITKAHSLNLEKDIIFMDFTKNPFNILKKAKMFVFSSIYEGLGNVLLEAMACGVPIISTDCYSGPREIIDNIYDYNKPITDIHIGKRGILVPMLSIDDTNITSRSLSNAIIMLLENEKLCQQLVANGEKYINEFPIDKILNEWKDVIENKGGIV